MRKKSNFQIKHKEMLITAPQVALLLSVSRSSVYSMAKRGAIPKPIKIGGSSKWQYGKLLEWLQEKDKEVNDYE